MMSTYIMNITAHEVPQTMRLENSEKKKCCMLGFDWSPNLPARQVHSHHLINVSLENPRSSQVFKYNPGKIMVDVKSENNH